MSRAEQPFDIVARPKHYNVHPSGIETIELSELPNANIANALKYCWRRNDKGNLKQELGKALWYARRHCESSFHVPIFASRDLLARFTYLGCKVIEHEQSGSLLAVVISAIAEGEPRRMLQRIEEELATIGA